MPKLDDNDMKMHFDLSPITPGQIKGFLRKKLSNSAPGDDKITYHILKKNSL